MHYIGLILGIFAGEAGIKNHVEKTGQFEVERPVCGGRIFLRRYHNYGAFRNLGQHHRKWVAACSVCLTLLLSALFVLTVGQCGKKTLKAGLSLLLGGAFSNTYDRLKRGFVVDYFSFGVKWKPLRDMVFNLADFCILIGAMLAVI